MDEKNFRKFLENSTYKGKKYTEKAIVSRIAKAKKAQELLNNTLDNIVSNDSKMFDALNILQKNENPAHNPMQNALRKYYEFKNGKEFPKKSKYNQNNN